MEVKKITDAMRAKLRYPLPSWALKKNPSKTFLTAINPIAIIHRLNDVFGVGGWQQEVKQIHQNEDSYVAVVRVTIPEYNIALEQAGGNNNGGSNKKGYDPGDAAKGAVTDAMTKIASMLEIGMDIFSNGEIPAIKGQKDLVKLSGLPQKKGGEQ